MRKRRDGTLRPAVSSTYQEAAKQYLRFKACHSLVHVMTRVLNRQYRKAVRPLKAEMERQRQIEKDKAAVQLQKHARG